MKKIFLFFLILFFIIFIFSENITIDPQKASEIKTPYNNGIKKGQLLKLKIEDNKAYIISGYCKGYRYYNGKPSGRNFNPSMGNLRIYDSNYKTDTLYFYGIKDSKLKINSDKMIQQVLNKGDSITYNLKSDNYIVIFYYNICNGDSTCYFNFYKNGNKNNIAPLKYRQKTLKKGKHNHITLDPADNNKIELIVSQGKMVVKIGQPF